MVHLSMGRRFPSSLPAKRSGCSVTQVFGMLCHLPSDGLRIPKNVSLIQLLPYSPELNPVENLWHYLRSHYWSLRVYRGYEELEEAAVGAWREVCLRPELVGSICAAPYVSNCA
jgi:hypothetical protein